MDEKERLLQEVKTWWRHGVFMSTDGGGKKIAVARAGEIAKDRTRGKLKVLMKRGECSRQSDLPRRSKEIKEGRKKQLRRT